MSSVLPFKGYTPEEVEAVFRPELEANAAKKRTTYDNEIKKFENSLKITPGKIIFPALGAILILGSVFALLAAYRVLPNGLNAISQLNPWGYTIGYGLLGVGILSLAISALLRVKLVREVNKGTDEARKQKEGIDFAYREVIQEKLSEDQIFVLKKETMYTIITKEKIYFYPTRADFNTWKGTLGHLNIEKTYDQLIENKKFITLVDLLNNESRKTEN